MCREPESNRHSPFGEQDFKSCASTSFATPAGEARVNFPNNEAPGGFEPPHKGFADLSLTTWVRRHLKTKIKPRRLVGLGAAEQLKEEEKRPRNRDQGSPFGRPRAGNGIRTRDIHLGKVTLYQLSYSRNWQG